VGTLCAWRGVFCNLLTDTSSCTTCSEICKSEVVVQFHSWSGLEPGNETVRLLLETLGVGEVSSRRHEEGGGGREEERDD
jgi:hypothetical protein